MVVGEPQPVVHRPAGRVVGVHPQAHDIAAVGEQQPGEPGGHRRREAPATRQWVHGDRGQMPDAGHRNLMTRAALVGGNKFAAELKDVLEKQDRVDGMGGPPPGSFLDQVGPLQTFLRRDFRTRQLYDESMADCYYVVASAYDHQAAVHGVRQLLWRSKMTADSLGVAMIDTLPGLILNAGKYLGRDMPVAATIYKPVSRDTSTKLGPLEVKEFIEKTLPDKPAEPKEKP